MSGFSIVSISFPGKPSSGYVSRIAKGVATIEVRATLNPGVAVERHTVVPIQSATISLRPSITRAISSPEARASLLPILAHALAHATRARWPPPAYLSFGRFLCAITSSTMP